LSPTQLRVIANGVPAPAGDGGAVRREIGVADGELLLVAAGSLVERKGHAVLLRALVGISAPWRLAIAGQGVERDALLALAASLGMSDRVHLLGQRADIGSWQRAADVFVMPSLWEGLPLALLEAMFTGSAIIASRTSGIPEAITDGVEGLLVPPGDVPALGAALARVLTDAPLRHALGAAARRRAEGHFSMERMTSAYEALYGVPITRV
jgi:glycosyltransferase involved in cell wall biosynthesis